MLSLLTLSFFASSSLSYLMDCEGTDCQYSFINCPPHEDCHVSCAHLHSCSHSVINCPVSGDCYIECSGTESCQDVVIYATLLTGNLDMLCAGPANTSDHCTGMQLYGNPVSQTSSSTFSVLCSGTDQSCSSSMIHCPSSTPCDITCDGNSSCAHSTIYGPSSSSSPLSVHCQASSSCLGATMNALHSSSLTVSGCTTASSCLDLFIYCPEATDTSKHCFIEGNDNLGRDLSSLSPSKSPTPAPTTRTMAPTMGTQSPSRNPSVSPTPAPSARPTRSPVHVPGSGLVIYAVNGWDDVSIAYSGSYGEKHAGSMRCGESFGVTCDVSETAWSCENGNDIDCAETQSAGTSASTTTTRNPTMTTIHSKSPTTTVVDTTHVAVVIGEDKSHETTHAVSDGHDDDGDDDHSGYDSHDDHYDSGEVAVVKQSEKMSADAFIVIGVTVVIVTFLCVGAAQYRKSVEETKAAQGRGPIAVMSSTRSLPSSVEYKHSSLSRKQSVSKSHVSSSRRSAYESVNNNTDHVIPVQ